MNTVNYVKVVFCMLIWVMVIFGSLINSFEKYFPVFVKQSVYYGKCAYREKTKFISNLEVPKSWFKHFYVYSTILSVSALLLTAKTYIFHSSVPLWVENVLDNVGGFYREPTVTPIHVLLSLTLFSLQCTRRLYDTQFVSVFGKSSKMNIFHYLLTYIHYTGAVLAILIEAPIYATTLKPVTLLITDLKLNDYIATLLFLWAWWHQYKLTEILANIRKNRTGSIISDTYNIPEGDWFKYLSAPHFVAEILMYFSLSVILWGNVTWLFIFFWVLSNQVELSLLNHWWYQKTFNNYPLERKAVIPYFY